MVLVPERIESLKKFITSGLMACLIVKIQYINFIKLEFQDVFTRVIKLITRLTNTTHLLYLSYIIFAGEHKGCESSGC